MIGNRIESRRRPPMLAALLGLGGLALLGTGLAIGDSNEAVGAVLPITLGVALYLARPRPFAARFTDEAIEVEHPAATIPYADLKGMWSHGRPIDAHKPPKRPFPIHLAHSSGILHIPARLDVTSAELYRFLVGQFEPSGSREVNPDLLEHLEKQEAIHGPARVWTYNAAKRRPPLGSWRVLRAFCLALAATGLAWVAYGSVRPNLQVAWGGIGVALLVVGLILFLVSFAQTTPVQRGLTNWKKSSLVVSPGGIGMVQGQIQGIVGWDELLDVRMNLKVRSFRVSTGTVPIGILLRVEGANIVIADLYDRPLSVIYERIIACRDGLDAGS